MFAQTTYYLFAKKIEPDFPYWADEIAEPRPDMNIKVAAFTVSQKSLNTKSETESRPPDKNLYLNIIFLISQPKHMLWVLKKTVSMRRFF